MNLSHSPLTIVLISILIIYPIFSNGQETFEISSSATMNYNNHVGNEWATRTDITIDGRTYDISHYKTVKVEVSSNSSISVTGVAQEDDKYSDTGENSVDIDAAEVIQNNGGSYFFTVKVREDRGRYAGNTAEWKFTIRFSN